MRWIEAGGIEWLEARLPRARVAFSTRIGGVSEEPFAGLNLGILTGDERAAVLENRHRLASGLGLDAQQVLIGRQVHGTELAQHSAAQAPSPYTEPGAPIPEVDGHVIERPGPAALVFAADCLPVALAGPGGVAILHCGWRGLAGGIIARGAVATGAVDAAIGPGIGPCCYQVGAEVTAAFEALGEGVVPDGDGLDLAEVARQLLRAAGVERVETAEHCTSCEPGRFFSHRRDGGHTGRQAGLAWLVPGGAVGKG
jgi:purine-nucleoside/S-methyl-5'-thioadenosine phosphorylase / adenosine deaminase